MLADCLTKPMDSSTLREFLRTGKYSLFDEDQILKQRADSRQRLKWIHDQNDNSQSFQSSENRTTEPREADTSEGWSEPVNSSSRISRCLEIWCWEPSAEN